MACWRLDADDLDRCQGLCKRNGLDLRELSLRQRFADQRKRFVCGFVSAPNQRVAGWALTTPLIDQILAIWNRWFKAQIGGRASRLLIKEAPMRKQFLCLVSRNAGADVVYCSCRALKHENIADVI